MISFSTKQGNNMMGWFTV